MENNNNNKQYISNETNPFVKLSKSFRVLLGVGMGLGVGCLTNGVYKRPFMSNSHIHAFWVVALGTLMYKSYDFNDYIVKRDIYTLSIHQQRIKEQDLLKQELKEKFGN